MQATAQLRSVEFDLDVDRAKEALLLLSLRATETQLIENTVTLLEGRLDATLGRATVLDVTAVHAALLSCLSARSTHEAVPSRASQVLQVMAFPASVLDALIALAAVARWETALAATWGSRAGETFWPPVVTACKSQCDASTLPWLRSIRDRDNGKGWRAFVDHAIDAVERGR